MAGVLRLPSKLHVLCLTLLLISLEAACGRPLQPILAGNLSLTGEDPAVRSENSCCDSSRLRRELTDAKKHEDLSRRNKYVGLVLGVLSKGSFAPSAPSKGHNSFNN
ncbi:hypothetical protein Nepgr_030543 [Nepenthes gracilis]|uniref:Uncharacterized protein n=1 Tax=Nepenthes gracilis TaxID=150966 RepID=A0AAD3TET5_NEPGR|nr:hypothetical protein Nepgr_030543 [Nepenthes gracilis]